MLTWSLCVRGERVCKSRANSYAPHAYPLLLFGVCTLSLLASMFLAVEHTMQKYRADTSETQKDGATVWRSNWMGGPSLARINNCRINIEGQPRRSVYIIAEPDTFFSIPAVTRYMGCRVMGYVTSEDGNLVFQPTYY